MAKKSNAERCREYRERKRAERAAVAKAAAPRRPRARKKAAEPDVEARREALRARYAALKADPKAYKAMLVKARERAARFHERRRAEKAKAKRGAR